MGTPEIALFSVLWIFFWWLVGLTIDRVMQRLKVTDNRAEAYERSGNFNDRQLNEIRTGIGNGVDVGLYANQGYSWKQMSLIREGLEKGLDVSWYARPEFDKRQMFWIRRGLELNLDVSVYASPEIDGKQMEKAVIGLLYKEG